MNSYFQAIKLLQYTPLPSMENDTELKSWSEDYRRKVNAVKSNANSDGALNTEMLALAFSVNEAKVEPEHVKLIEKAGTILNGSAENSANFANYTAILHLSHAYTEALKGIGLHIDALMHSIELSVISLKAVQKGIDKAKSSGVEYGHYALFNLLSSQANNIVERVFQRNNDLDSQSARSEFYEYIIDIYCNEDSQDLPMQFADIFLKHAELWIDNFWFEAYNYPIPSNCYDQMFSHLQTFCFNNPEFLESCLPTSLDSRNSNPEADAAIFQAHLDDKNPLQANKTLTRFLNDEISKFANNWRTFDLDLFASEIGSYIALLTNTVQTFQSYIHTKAKPEKTNTKPESSKGKPKKTTKSKANKAETKKSVAGNLINEKMEKIRQKSNSSKSQEPQLDLLSDET